MRIAHLLELTFDNGDTLIRSLIQKMNEMSLRSPVGTADLKTNTQPKPGFHGIVLSVCYLKTNQPNKNPKIQI